MSAEQCNPQVCPVRQKEGEGRWLSGNLCYSGEQGFEVGTWKKKGMTEGALRWQLVDGLVLLSMHPD